jgi:hypothetical protein
MKRDGGDEEDASAKISIIDGNVRKDKKQKLEELLAQLSQKHA